MYILPWLLLQVAAGVPQAPEAVSESLPVALRSFEDPNVPSDIQKALAIPPTAYTVEYGDNLSRIIQRKYGVTQSDHPALFTVLTDWIVRSSDLRNPDTLQVGDTLWIPVLPLYAPGGRVGPSQTVTVQIKRRPLTAKTCDEYERSLYSASIKPALDSAAHLTTDFQVTGQPNDMRCVIAEWNRIHAESQSSIRTTLFQSMLEIDINPVADSVAFNPFQPSTKLEATIKRIVTTPDARPVYLYIIDSGWPSRPQRDYSVGQLLSLVRRLNDRYGLEMSLPDDPPVSEDFAPASNPHATHIFSALEPLEALDHQDNVRVIYVPLTLEQNAREIMLLLYSAYYRLREKEALAGSCHDTDCNTTVDLSLIQGLILDRKAEAALRGLPEKQVGNTVRTNTSLLDVLRLLLIRDAEASYRPFIVNLSWTIAYSSIELGDYGPIGLFVVAAGNSSRNVDTRSRRVEFAWRGTVPHGFITVMNADTTGALRCSSSAFWTPPKPPPPEILPHLAAVSFNGRVESGPCGTSFAAPRVAWLLAASAVPNDVTNVSKWAYTLIAERLLPLRRAEGTPSRRLYFNPEQYLNQVRVP